MSYSHSAKIGTSMILVAAAIAVGAVAQSITEEKKEPRSHTRLLTKLTTLTRPDQCAPTILMSPATRCRKLPATRKRCAATCHYRKNVIPSVCCRLPDSQPLPRCRGLLHQLQFEDTIVVFCLARRLVQLRGQGEATIDVAEIPLVAEQPVAFFLIPFPLYFGGDGDLIALDRDVDVFLPHTGHFGMDPVTILGFDHIHLDRYRGRCAFQAHGLEEAAEQFVETGVGAWIVRDEVLHNACLSN